MGGSSMPPRAPGSTENRLQAGTALSVPSVDRACLTNLKTRRSKAWKSGRIREISAAAAGAI